jgi:MazG family protein
LRRDRGKTGGTMEDPQTNDDRDARTPRSQAGAPAAAAPPHSDAEALPADASAPSAAGRDDAATFDDLLRVMRRLLGPGGCEWDRAQTPASLLPYLLEEAYEAREAVLAGDDAALAEELGDLALQVAFQALLAEGRGAFGPSAVFAAIVGKMVRRHPHVFGEGAGSAAGAPPPWEELKRREREAKGASGARVSLMEGIPLALPALLKAQRVQERAAGVGFDWDDLLGPLAKVREELGEVEGQLGAGGGDLAEEIGDLLFAVVNLARRAGIASEDALDRATSKFRRRFERLEKLAAERGIELATAGLAPLDSLWDEVKRRE